MAFCGCLDFTLGQAQPAAPPAPQGSASMGDFPSRCCTTLKASNGSSSNADGEDQVDECLDPGAVIHKIPSKIVTPAQVLSPPSFSNTAEDHTSTVFSLDAPLPDVMRENVPAGGDTAAIDKSKVTSSVATQGLTRAELRHGHSFDSHHSDHRTPRVTIADGEFETVDCLIGNATSQAIVSSSMSDEDDDFAMELNYAKELLRTTAGIKHFRHHQFSLIRIVELLFLQDEQLGPTMTGISTVSSSKPNFVQAMEIAGIPLRKRAQKIINNSVFTIFFMTLTFYAIFGPDLVVLLLSNRHDKPFFITNTAVFFLFVIELCILLVGRTNYVCTITFLLDVVSCASLFFDTWFMKGGMISQDGQRVGRMARTTRLTRLVKIVRVARLTRLLPGLMRLCGKQRNDLANKLLMRRLWRSFLYLDTDQDGMITYRDLKCYYVTLLCHSSLGADSASAEVLFNADKSKLCRGDDPDDSLNYLEFEDFRKLLMSMSLGKALMQFHIEDVDRDQGVWTMTQKLSDSIAIKVCVGLLILIGVYDLLQMHETDRGVDQALDQLITVAQGETPYVNGVILNTGYLCEQIALFTKSYAVLYLFINGGTYFKDGSCLAQGINRTVLNPFAHIKDVISKEDLRDNEYIQTCFPDNKFCEENKVTSLVLVDNTDEVWNDVFADVMRTLIVIVMLLIFVYVLNLGITSFSKSLLQPLRALVDDMTAMSALELVNVDKELPVENLKSVKKSPKVVEELMHLQSACKGMRSAVKSWAKYVPPAVVERLFSSGLEAQIGVARVTATIMFVDILEFEHAIVGLRPEEVLNLLAGVLDKIAEVIASHNGTLLEFIGDEVMACFNTPMPLKDHKFAGAATVVQIHRIIADLPPIKMANGTETHIRCRTGVNSGSVLAGNLGSQQRMKYGLLGDSVNLTARMKGINTKYKTRVLASKVIVEDPYVIESIVFRLVDLVTVKGKKEPTPIFELLANRHSKDEADMPRLLRMQEACYKHEQAFDLYTSRKFREAKALFDEVQPIFDEVDSPEPSSMLSMRCQRYIDDPPPDDWDGVERLTKK